MLLDQQMQLDQLCGRNMQLRELGKHATSTL